MLVTLAVVNDETICNQQCLEWGFHQVGRPLDVTLGAGSVRLNQMFMMPTCKSSLVCYKPPEPTRLVPII
eukprot:2762015-Pyramimonas_sp.AAC.1